MAAAGGAGRRTTTTLLRHLVDEVRAEGHKLSGSLQGNFDLLGESLKFNRPGLRSFDALLPPERFVALSKVVIANLVDSNVFVRSLLLSVHRFQALDATGASDPRPPSAVGEPRSITVSQQSTRLPPSSKSAQPGCESASNMAAADAEHSPHHWRTVSA